MGTANSRLLACGEDTGVEEEQEARGPGLGRGKAMRLSSTGNVKCYRECWKEGLGRGVSELGHGGDDVRWKTT